MDIAWQLIYMMILPIPIACITWTFTHEEIFRAWREVCIFKSKNCKRLIERKFFYVFTCEYCFSHYVTICALIITRYTLLLSDWRGYIVSGFTLVWLANIYMSLYARIRVDIKAEQEEIRLKEERMKNKEPGK